MTLKTERRPLFARDFPRPLFARDFPRDPDLDRLVEWFVRGNHRRVRDEAEALARRADDPRVAAAARKLAARLAPDWIAYVLLGSTAVLLLVLTLWAVRRSHQHPPPPPPVRTVQTVTR